MAFADGNLFFNRSGMTISQTPEILAEMLHGVTFGAPTEGVPWCWIDQVGRYIPRPEQAAHHEARSLIVEQRQG